jgi:hypothetical protein
MVVSLEFLISASIWLFLRYFTVHNTTQR